MIQEIQREKTLRPYDYCVFLSAGHGGIDKSGKYTTYPSKWTKFNDQAYLYEGEKNREYCRLIHKKLAERDIHVVPLYHNYKDTSRHHRTSFANIYHSTIQKGIYHSEHSNAFNKRVRGFCIFTSRGTTQSDGLAELFVKGFQKKFPNVPVHGTGEYDRDFDEVADTSMNALLFENMFFDNEEDAQLLLSEQYKEEYTTLVADFYEAVISVRSGLEVPCNNLFSFISNKQ